MKKLLFLVSAAVAVAGSLSAAWTYDATEGTISDGVWKFGATVKNGTELTVNAVQVAPSEVSPLDFSQPVTDADGASYTIVKLNTQFGSRINTWGNPEDFVGSPEGVKVGALALPASGLTEISDCAFAFCSNATGVVSLSSDLVKIGNAAFDHCDGITGFNPLVPDSVTSIGDFAFAYTAPAQDVSLKNVATITYGLFTGTPITSVYIGPKFKKFTSMNYKNGTFMNCSSLTNVTFDPEISGAQWMNGAGSGQSTFSGCPALEGVLDLSGFTKLYSQWGNFGGCGKVRQVIIGENIEAIDMNFFGGLTALESVVFKGNPPATMGLPIYNNVETAAKKKYKFATYIYEDYKDDWLAYAKDGVINYDDSEFDSTKISSGLATSMRPLRFYPPSAPIIDSVVASGATSNEVTVTVLGSVLCGGTILVEILDELGRVAVSVSTNDFGSLVIGELEILTKYSVRVTASNGIGTTVDASAKFETTDGPGAELNECFKVGRHDWVFRFRRTGVNKFRAPAKMVGPVKLLVVGGGGGGGSISGGGGGGGGVLYREDVVIEPNMTYTVTVGAGGAAGTAKGGGRGGSSSFVSVDGIMNITVEGGGGGAGGYEKMQGGSGANGGGGCMAPGGVPSGQYGFSGGIGDDTKAGGGGGGAGGPGQDASARGSGFGGNGGPGVTNAITGVGVVYGYGGGGAGNYYTARNGHYGLGGAMNGYGDSAGVGQYDTPSFQARSGEDGTGGGGGAGASNATSFAPARGGSGVVIIRYTEPLPGLMLIVR